MSQQGKLEDTGLDTLTGNSGGAVSPDTAGNINIVGSSPYSFTGNPATFTLTLTDDGTVATSFVTDSGSAIPSGNVLNILGTSSQGISNSGTGNTITFTISDATPTQKGVLETATDAESIAGSSTTVANTPASLSAKLGSQTANGIPYGSGTSSALSWTSVASDGQLLIGATGAAPAPASLTSTGGTLTYTAGSNSLNIDLAANVQSTGINAWNGAIIETPSVTVSSNGTVITLSVERSGGGDLTVVFSDGFYAWDTTPADTVTLTAGTDTVPQINYIYFLQSTKTLTASTTAFPSTEYAPIAQVICQSAATLQTDGPYKQQNWTDHVIDTNNEGHISHLNYWIRQQTATYASGS
jgi:hypothetical protein